MSSEKNFFRRWLDGQVDWSAMLEQEKPAPKAENDAYKPRWDAESARRSMEQGQIAYTVLAIVACIVFAAFMLLTVANLPGYGSADAPTVNEVAERYVEKGTEETGAVNTVAGMILDYRAFDTLGESFVLFTAMCAVTMLMNAPGRRRVRKLDYEVLDYYQDPIIRTVCKFVIPIILVFGVYILLNGHLSPGGGFSGGAIMGAGLILYLNAFGFKRTERFFTFTTFKIVSCVALSFYALSKAYSFFTGANHLPSIITTGTPGMIFSAGLIPYLNIAVGLVVCCTMYAFYTLFRKGDM